MTQNTKQNTKQNNTKKVILTKEEAERPLYGMQAIEYWERDVSPTTTYLNIGQNILDYNENYLNGLKLIKEARTNNNNILKLVLNLFLIQIKELKNRKDMIQFNKKAILQIVKINLEAKLSKKFQDIIKAIFIYLESNSVLDLKELTVSSFISGMKLLNDDDTIKKYKSNDDLLDTLKDYNDNKRVESAKKLLGL
jgi:hypothetical protein